MINFRIKIVGWKIIIENIGKYYIKDILSPWHCWYRGKRLKFQLCKFYPFKDVLELNDKGECTTKNYGIESLKDGYWYSSVASTFNDVSDCNPELLSISNIYKIYKESSKNIGVISIDEFKQMLIEKQLEVFNDKLGITCFTHTKNIKNHLMWAHYADEHKGVCIEFKPTELFSERMFLPAIYVRRKPKIPLIDVIHFLPLIKTICWKYEKEIRLISFNIRNGNRKIAFNPAQVLEIYFGVRFKENKNMQEVLEIINNKYPHAKLFQMHLNKKNIRMKAMQVSINFDNGRYYL